MPNNESQSLAAHSHDSSEIFGRLPTWIIRWGITVVASILLVIIIASCFIRYPQTLISDIILSSDNPPSDLVARFSGILDSVYVSDGAVVERGDAIALIATPAKYEDIRKVEDLLLRLYDSVRINDTHLVLQMQGLRLGDLQSEWISLQRACADYLNWMDIDQAGRKIAMLKKLAVESEEYAGLLQQERHNVQENYRLGVIAFQRDSILHSDELISQADYEQSVIQLHAKENELTSLDVSISNARINKLELESQILNIQLQASSEEIEFIQDIRRSVRQLLARIDLWEETYAFIAPFSGYVSLQNVWSRGQHISVGDIVASITRTQGSIITGRLKVPSSGFGKVKIGQRVIVRLNGYPYLEFGVLSGKVTAISSVPTQTTDGLCYTVTTSFPSGMETTYHRILPFVQQMDGQAEIVTEDMRLIEQFIRPIRSVFVNH